MTATAFFHEDDYRQVELLPASDREHCLAEVGRIDEFAAAHQDGAGFTEMYVRGEVPHTLASLGITLAELRSALDALLPRFGAVLTGYTTYREPCPAVSGWGTGDGQALFASAGEEGVLQAVWLSLYGLTEKDAALWCRVFRSLPRAEALLLVDWNRGEVVPLSDEARLTAYLRGESA
jgi:hypothetical protein